MSDIFDKTTRALGASVNLRQLRNNVISSNIANAETPGYVAKKVEFENALQRAIALEGTKAARENPDHILTGQGSISKVRADVFDNPEVNINPDGNTVNLEAEMSQLAENSLIYRAAIQLINKKLAGLKYAVSEGGR